MRGGRGASAGLVMAIVGLLLVGCGSTGHPEAPNRPSSATRGSSTPPSTAAANSASSSTSTSSSSTSIPSTSGSWLTFHGDSSRSGLDHSGVRLGSLHRAWTSPTLDGQIYAEPLVWRGYVIVATEDDTVYALAAGSGRIAWSRHLGPPVPLSDLACGDIDPEGVTATPVIDPVDGRLFVLDETLQNGSVSHQLVALAAATGQIQFQESADPPGMDVAYQQARSALLLSGGRVYGAYGGLYGDCGNYYGWVVSAPASGVGALSAFHVPAQNQGAIWAPGGPVLLASGRLLVATGNGSSGRAYDYGDSVIELSPSLSITDHFAPSSWSYDNTHDLDLGSTSPQPVGAGMVLQVGKESEGYLLSTARLGGLGGQLFQGPLCYVQGGADATSGDDVYVPCTRGGLEDVRITTSGAPAFHVAWTAPVSGSPVVAGGLVWLMAGPSLYGLDPGDGHIAQQVALAQSPEHFATPSVGDGLLVVAAGRVVQAFTGS